MQIENSEESII